ncbi:Hypothetical predicted protein [Podarcis lilfordi]|uniref:Uncharacterized protein n=1 Tax=Podarcis lilfordi TaxID=74358 RepID=A0AA35KXN0_9SAUR|nr:Hypothetical predicted protein [Podarcis lilfordi]
MSREFMLSGCERLEIRCKRPLWPPPPHPVEHTADGAILGRCGGHSGSRYRRCRKILNQEEQ